MTNYGAAIREGFQYLLANKPEVFTIGQGLWSPWYVGNSMTDLDIEFGKERVIDTPVSELACTGAALGASLCGYRPIVIHPRIDFMLLAVDQIVTQAAKWRSMFGGSVDAPVTIRGIINRGGEQGAQHSQSLHSWFAHVPGLQVVMPSTARDARDLLIASVLSNDPTLYIDDRWLYELEEDLPPAEDVDLRAIRPTVQRYGDGSDCTLVGVGHSAHLCRVAAQTLLADGVQCTVIDPRVLNPMDATAVAESVEETGRLVAVDGDWSSCGFAAEFLARAAESVPPERWRAAPRRVTFPAAPAPTSKPLETSFYFTANDVVAAVRQVVARSASRAESEMESLPLAHV